MIKTFLKLVLPALLETVQMVFLSTFFACLLGLLLAIILFLTKPKAQGGLHPNALLNVFLSKLINILRSFPFIILMILLLPFTRFVLGTAIGTTACVIPLSIAAAPFVARLLESAFSTMDGGLIDAAKVMGSSDADIIFKVLIPEILPQIVDAITMTIINLVGYSAMAGAIGAGGLGDLALRYGYQRFRTDIMIMAVIAIILFVEIVQLSGNAISRSIYKKR